MFIVNTSLYFITYNHGYYHVCEIILYYPNLTISELLIVPIGLDILTEYTIIFIVTVYFCISMSDELGLCLGWKGQ